MISSRFPTRPTRTCARSWITRSICTSSGKEIRFGPNTDEHDFQFKLKHAQEFLQEGSKVKASIFFRGRSIMFAEQGEKQLLRFAVELEEFGRAENMPVLEGKRMSMMIAPLKKK